MKKTILTLVFVVFLASWVYAGGFETRIVFVPDYSKYGKEQLIATTTGMIELWYNDSSDSVKNIIRKGLYTEPLDFYINEKLKMLDTFTYNLNALTEKGWEIKTSRRAWTDLNYNHEPDDFEWGTEYTLQRKK